MLVYRKVFVFFILALPWSWLAAQSDTIEVAKVALKVGPRSTEELFYAFAEGDRIIFDFSELDGNAISEFTISEYPDQPRFQQVNTAQVLKGELRAARTGVYSFRFSNRALLKGRTCGLYLRRIPASSRYRSFNTAIRWEERYDTTIVATGKDKRMETRLVERRRRVLAKTDTLVASLIDRVERVHSRTNLSGPASSIIEVELPAATAEPNAGQPYLTTEVVSWSYWIGVGKEGEAAFEKGNQVARLARAAAGAAEAIGLVSGGYGALIALAIEGVSYFTLPKKGDNIKFRILEGEEILEEGDSRAAFARLLKPLQGTLRFELTNDNLFQSVDVNLRLVAVVVRRQYQEEIYHEEEEAPVVERVIRLVRVPVVQGN